MVMMMMIAIERGECVGLMLKDEDGNLFNAHFHTESQSANLPLGTVQPIKLT